MKILALRQSEFPLYVRLLNCLLNERLFRILNGSLQAQLDEGSLITTNQWLDQRGVPVNFRDGWRSWYGRSVAQAFRHVCGTDPDRAWVQHRSQPLFVPVFVYSPSDPALIKGALTYKRTVHLAA